VTAALAGLPPLRETLAEAGLLADKRLGQHFLFDLNLTRKIARLAAVGQDSTVIEVGPGPGGLTRALLETGAQVLAIERDPRFTPLLEVIGGAASGRLHRVQADALRVDELAALAAAGLASDATVVSNLPYNVGTPLFIKWLTGPFRPRSMTLMFQAEVAARIVASPGASAYGRLAVIAQATCRTAKILDVPPQAFTPPPRVRSAVIRAEPFAIQPEDAILGRLQEVTAAAFGQRRKKLRSSLASLGGAALCSDAGVDPDLRAERLGVDGFLALATALLR
jgi:16S rRNA (adenine1518-N6/adenine1519-N6)-dimethyltransferase